ncbi:MAG: DUF3991 and toprim domain-containing protein [Eubacteriales bacterium]|nr:DUF3991 and toprim domain-containing protein [Eubacteriales bacterium]
MLRRSGSEWEWRCGDSKITIRGNEWYHHYDRIGGGAVDFVKRFFNVDYPQAVQMLLGSDCGTILNYPAGNQVKEKKPFLLPEANSDMRRLYAYLLKQRFIDRDIVYHFTHNKLLFEDAKNHNAVFVGCDEKGVPQHAHKRGTGFVSGYKGNVEGSLPKYSFHHIGTSDRLYVFEAPVDLLSYLTLHPENWQQHSYVGLCCTAEHAVIYQLRQNPHINCVILCLDHDKAGIEGSYRIADGIQKMNRSYQILMQQPMHKDWNEILKEKNGVEPIPGTKHPTMEHIRELCESLAWECDDEKCPRYPFDDLMGKYNKLGRTSPQNVEAITEQTFEMAKAALVFCVARHRHMGVYVQDDWYSDTMFVQYKPQRDNGGYKSHLQDIRMHLQSIIKDYSVDRIYTKSEIENQITRTLEVGLDCLRLSAFVTLSQEQTQIDSMLMQ